MNEQWKNAYREGFADGYAAAKKEMNYGNFPQVYYGGATPRKDYGIDPRSSASSTRATGYPPTGPFATGMSVSSSDC